MRKLAFILALFVSIVSCNKKEEKDTSCSHGDATCVDGYIRWGGDPAADGSGWNLRTGDESSATNYILKNLPDKFKKVGIAVTACVEETDEQLLVFV